MTKGILSDKVIHGIVATHSPGTPQQNVALASALVNAMEPATTSAPRKAPAAATKAKPAGSKPTAGKAKPAPRIVSARVKR